MAVLIEAKGSERRHRPKFQALLRQTSGPVRIASAYVTDKHLLGNLQGRDVCLITNLSRMDIVAGATSLESLKALIEAGVRCKYMPPEGLRLHAKVYLFGEQSAVVTSCNLTNNALQNNIEVGVHLSDEDVLHSSIGSLSCARVRLNSRRIKYLNCRKRRKQIDLNTRR